MSAVSIAPAKRVGAASRVWPATRWLLLAIALVALGRYAQPPEILRGPGSRGMLPRLPGPAPDFRTLLYQLGVGSLIWYAVVVAFPLLLLGARHVDAERHGRGR